MQNYERMIIEHLVGTPKEKYEYLLELEKSNAKLKGKMECALNTFKGLVESSDTATIGNLRTIIEANYEVLSKS